MVIAHKAAIKDLFASLYVSIFFDNKRKWPSMIKRKNISANRLDLSMAAVQKARDFY